MHKRCATFRCSFVNLPSRHCKLFLFDDKKPPCQLWHSFWCQWTNHFSTKLKIQTWNVQLDFTTFCGTADLSQRFKCASRIDFEESNQNIHQKCHSTHFLSSKYPKFYKTFPKVVKSDLVEKFRNSYRKPTENTKKFQNCSIQRLHRKTFHYWFHNAF